jgi:hypothetical protein
MPTKPPFDNIYPQITPLARRSLRLGEQIFADYYLNINPFRCLYGLIILQRLINETKTCLFSAKPGCRGGSPVKFACGRPVDIVEMKDGSLIVSDDRVGAIYRITYEQ